MPPHPELEDEPYRHPKVDRPRGAPRENPAGLRQPAEYQFHGTLVAIILAVVALIAVFGPMLLRTENKTITANVVDTIAEDGRLRVVLQVTNTTDADAAVNCNVVATGERGVIGSVVVRTHVLLPDQTETLAGVIEDVTDRASSVRATCSPA